MDSLDRDRSKTHPQFGEPRSADSTESWWRLGVGAALLLVAGGGVSPRSVVRALAVAGGGMLVYQALTGSDGLLARHGERSLDDRLTTGDTNAMGTYIRRTTGTQEGGISPQEEPALAGSEGIPPIDTRGA